MKSFVVVSALFAGVLAWQLFPMTAFSPSENYTEGEVGFEDPAMDVHGVGIDESVLELVQPLSFSTGRVRWAEYWRPFSQEEAAYYAREREPGPARVGVQVGHWEHENVPEELAGLRTSSGAVSGNSTEQEIVLEISERVRDTLEAEGIKVDLLSTTIPVDYEADAFVSIHADGNNSPSVSGYKISGPRRDFSGGAEALVEALYDSYGEATGLRRDGNVTRRMSSYYAFNWRRYDHAVHPMVPAAIVETGFVTSPTDRAIILNQPERAARGIATGILRFLEERGVLE